MDVEFNKVVIDRRRDGVLEVYVGPIPDWEGFDKLVQFLKNEYATEVKEQFDGPGARRWILQVEGHNLELHHEDPWGNSLIAPQKESEKILRRIGEDLTRRFKAV